MNKTDKHNNELLAGTCLLIGIANSDEKFQNSEYQIIKDIIQDFFGCDENLLNDTIVSAKKKLNDSTDIYEFSKTLNSLFTYQDKIDFISCAFEVAYIDGSMHYLEEHFIKKIANVLNIEHSDLIKAKNSQKNI